MARIYGRLASGELLTDKSNSEKDIETRKALKEIYNMMNRIHPYAHQITITLRYDGIAIMEADVESKYYETMTIGGNINAD